jgi:DNA-nicking Smr family endonuclease
VTETEKNDDVAIHIPIDGTLDLHTFNPREVQDLLEEYINACLEKGIYEVRIIHGKGKGILRDKVHSILKRHPLVMDFSLDPGASGWGATIVLLKKD